MDIIYTIPGHELEARKDFARLAALMGQDIDPAQTTSFSPDAPGVSRPFTTIFNLDSGAKNAGLKFRKNNLWSYTANSFLCDTSGREVHMSFAEATRRLKGHVQRIDHTGVCVPSHLTPIDWLRVVEPLSATQALREYPEGADGYDHEKNLWYFMVDETAAEPGATPTTKFELVHDGAPRSLVQLDIQTSLTRYDIKELFPDSFEIDGLGQYFRSLNVTTLWPGMRTMRLDLRYAVADPDWTSGRYLIQNGKKVAPGEGRLPEFRPSFERV